MTLGWVPTDQCGLTEQTFPTPVLRHAAVKTRSTIGHCNSSWIQRRCNTVKL